MQTRPVQTVCVTLNTASGRKLDFSFDRAGRETWFDVLTGPVRYRASTPWSPAAAIGVTALITSVQLALYELSPGLGLSLILEIVTGCLVWFAAGLGNGTTRA